MAAYPPEVEAFHDALKRLKAVEEVDTGLKELAKYRPETYSLPGEFGDFPHTLLRRTHGGLADEAWAHTEFSLARNEEGWLTLEFIAWWVRDSSRGGEQIQLRPMALPPKGYDIQLGRTLKFIIDHFAICPTDPSPMLALFAERAKFLVLMIDNYRAELGDLVRA